jgi:hypothetical protein
MLIAKPVSFFQSPLSPVSHAASNNRSSYLSISANGEQIEPKVLMMPMETGKKFRECRGWNKNR